MTTDENRLMTYATAIAHDELTYLYGACDYRLPPLDHPHWAVWKRTAAAVMQVADRESPPPPPGDTREQIPADILALIVPRRYLSTACEAAQALESAKIRHPDRRGELDLWRERMHNRCRINNKFTSLLCACPHHTKDA